MNGLLTVGCVALVATVCSGNEARLYRTTLERDFREVEGTVASAQTGPGTKLVDLDAAKPRHEFLGLGVSFAEASCHLLMKLPAAERRAVLESVFGKDGIGLSVGRIHMGASDYSRRLYSYDDVPGDVKLEHFSINPDRAEVLPVVKEALAVNPDLYYFSSQWSPPGWMKENGTLCGGPLRDDMLGVYTDYFVRFLRAYREEGVDIRAFTVQNEPTANQDYNSPTCFLPPEREIAAIKMLVPKLRASGLGAKPWLFDQNFDATGRVEKCLEDAELRSLIGGVAWHPYAGKPEMIVPLKAKYPDLPMYQTEMGPHVDKAQRNLVWWGQLMARAFNSGCGAFCSWCLALDEDGQPNVSCGFPCAGFVEIHSETHAVTPSSQYKAFRHVSPFVKRGAKILDAPLVCGPRVSAWSRKQRPLEGLFVTTFRNPDGSDVVFIAYDLPEKPFGRVQVQIKRNGLYLPVQVLANSLTTIVFPADEMWEPQRGIAGLFRPDPQHDLTRDPLWQARYRTLVSTADGTKQPFYWYDPPCEAAVPLLVALHTWSENCNWSSPARAAFDYCRTNGWAMIYPNFRGANDRPEACGSDLAVQDVVDTVNWARRMRKVDESRIYVIGGSGGGHMSLLMAARHPEIFAASAAFCPISDIKRWFDDSTARRNGYEKMIQASCGGTPAERPDEYVRRSPLTYLPQVRTSGPSVYIATGIHDGHRGSVPIGHAIRAYNALAEEADRISENDIAFIESREDVPEDLRFKGKDPFYGMANRVHLRMTSRNVRLTLFEGGHSGNLAAGLDFLSRQRLGARADMSLPDAAKTSVEDVTH